MSDKNKTGPAADDRKPAQPPSEGTRRVRSTELLGDGGRLIIEHAGREYRLCVTSNGKLILTA